RGLRLGERCRGVLLGHCAGHIFHVRLGNVCLRLPAGEREADPREGRLHGRLRSSGSGRSKSSVTSSEGRSVRSEGGSKRTCFGSSTSGASAAGTSRSRRRNQRCFGRASSGSSLGRSGSAATGSRSGAGSGSGRTGAAGSTRGAIIVTA